MKAIPKPWLADGTPRANVAFLRRGTDSKQVVRELEPDPAIEEVKAVSGAIQRDAQAHRGAYKEPTVRNLNIWAT